ncbi:hypothetical protein KEM55_009263, partial [Ascosphaera atra]
KYLRGNPEIFWMEYQIRSGVTHHLISYPDVLKPRDDDKDDYDYVLCSEEDREELQVCTIGYFLFYPCMAEIEKDGMVCVGNERRSAESVAEMHRKSGISLHDRKNRLPFITDVSFGPWAISNAMIGQSDWTDPSVVYELEEYDRSTDEDKAETLKEWREWIVGDYETKFNAQWKAEIATMGRRSWCRFMTERYSAAAQKDFVSLMNGSAEAYHKYLRSRKKRDTLMVDPEDLANDEDDEVSAVEEAADDEEVVEDDGQEQQQEENNAEGEEEYVPADEEES